MVVRGQTASHTHARRPHLFAVALSLSLTHTHGRTHHTHTHTTRSPSLRPRPSLYTLVRDVADLGERRRRVQCARRASSFAFDVVREYRLPGATRTVQATWRGVMVRRRLEAYRRRKAIWEKRRHEWQLYREVVSRHCFTA